MSWLLTLWFTVDFIFRRILTRTPWPWSGPWSRAAPRPSWSWYWPRGRGSGADTAHPRPWETGTDAGQTKTNSCLNIITKKGFVYEDDVVAAPDIKYCNIENMSDVSSPIYFPLHHPYDLKAHINHCARSRVGTISLLEGPLAKYGEGAKYIELFVTALRQYGMLCIGLYRWKKIKHILKKVVHWQ